MTPDLLIESLIYAVRIFLLVTIPLLAILTLAGTISGMLQAITGIRESLLNYLTKLIALFAVFYFFLPSFLQTLEEMFNNYYL